MRYWFGDVGVWLYVKAQVGDRTQVQVLEAEQSLTFEAFRAVHISVEQIKLSVLDVILQHNVLEHVSDPYVYISTYIFASEQHDAEEMPSD